MFAILTGSPAGRSRASRRGRTDIRWALVLTHDVEHAKGLAASSPVIELERAHGVRSVLEPRAETL